MWRRGAAGALERGAAADGLRARLAKVWARHARPERAVELPRDCSVVGIAGATLGGSGATPIAIELARALAAKGLSVGLVGHGYRAPGRRVRRVMADSDWRQVGDEALQAARALDPVGVPVWIGPRELALAAAARHADVVLADGLLQTRPVSLATSCLVVDGASPWGAGQCPPAGDLRAPQERLIAASDVVLALTPKGVAVDSRLREPHLVVSWTEPELLGPAGQRRPLSWLRGRRFGVAVAIARPLRVLDELARVGLAPSAVRLGADHAVPPRGRPADVELWLGTPKCQPKLGRQFQGRPFWVLQRCLNLPPTLLQRVAGGGVSIDPKGLRS